MFPYTEIKKYPSQIKYEKNNPTITFRMKKHEKERIRLMVESSGKSISQLVRENLLQAEKNYSDAYEKGKEQHRIWIFCNVCGKAIYILPNSNDHKAIIEYMKENRWGHPNCHEQ